MLTIFKHYHISIYMHTLHTHDFENIIIQMEEKYPTDDLTSPISLIHNCLRHICNIVTKLIVGFLEYVSYRYQCGHK